MKEVSSSTSLIATSKIQKLETKIADLEAEKAQSRNEVEELQIKVAGLEAALQAKSLTSSFKLSKAKKAQENSEKEALMERIKNLQAENLKLTEENKKLDKQLVQVGEDVYKVLLKQVEDLKKENDALNLVNDSLMSEISVYKNSKTSNGRRENRC